MRQTFAVRGRGPTVITHCGPKETTHLPICSYAAEVLSKLPGPLVLTRMVQLDSVPLDSPLLAETLLAETLLRSSSDFGGITTLSPAAAAALASVPNREVKYRDGMVRTLPPYHLSFPSLSELSPEAARILVQSLNRGTEVAVWGGLNQAPKLFIGGRIPSGLSLDSPALAARLIQDSSGGVLPSLRTIRPPRRKSLSAVPTRSTLG